MGTSQKPGTKATSKPGKKVEKFTEVGRWEDKKLPALYIVYHMQKEVSEAELAKLQKPIARSFAGKYAFVVQVTVHDVAWAKRLSSEEMRKRVNDDELPVGSPLLTHDSMKVQGGLCYTW